MMKSCSCSHRRSFWTILVLLCCCCGNANASDLPLVSPEDSDITVESEASSDGPRIEPVSKELDRETSSGDDVLLANPPIVETKEDEEVPGSPNGLKTMSSVPPPPSLDVDQRSQLDDSSYGSVVVTSSNEPVQNESSEETVPESSDVETPDTTTRSSVVVELSDSGPIEPILGLFADLQSTDSFETVVVASEGKINASYADGTIATPDVDPAHGILESGGPTATEDMPSFNEWAKKRLEEQGQRPQVSTSQISKPPATLKKRHKNYASVDCGAKVLAANPEAQSSSAVLSHYQDDYMLNPCTAKIWLVIELCEAIQVDRLELANFELFSSSPKEFSVFSSDRYPSRDWSFLGTFEARDEKSVQSFMLHQTAFSKYVKIEMVSHYGTEHFCPLSLVRVYGTSEYEALETEEQAPDDAAVHSVSPDDEDLEVDLVQGSTNLFGSAKDAVMTIVKKAAEVLRPGDKAAISSGTENQTDRRNAFYGKNCVCLQRLPNVDCQGIEHVSMSEHNSSLLEQSVSFLSCNYDSLSTGLRSLSIRKEVGSFVEACSDHCSVYLEGVAVANLNRSSKCAFYRAVLGDARFGALCLFDKLLLDHEKEKPIEQKYCPFSLPLPSSVCATFVSMDTSDIPISISSHQLTASLNSNIELLSHLLTSLSVADDSNSRSSVSNDEIIVSETSVKSGVYLSQIDPTRTFSTHGGCGEEPRKVTTDTALFGDTIALDSDSCSLNTLTVDSADQSNAHITTASYSLSRDKLSSVKEPIEEDVSEIHVASSSSGTTIVLPSVSVANVSQSNEVDSDSLLYEDVSAPIVVEAPPSSSDMVQDSLFLVEVEHDGGSLSSSHLEATASSNTTGKLPVVLPGMIVGTPMSPGQKESVFVRLSNRIKALELNMSLSSQYLEELSRRYRKQMEEMQKAFNKTIGALNETARKAHERDLRQQEMIGLLQMQLDSLSKVVTQMAEQQENLHAQVISRHLVLMTIEALVMMVAFVACARPSHRSRTRQIRSPAVGRVSPERVTDRGVTAAATPIRAIAGRPPRRRNSDPTLVESSPSALLSERRRPSTEALNVSGTYSDLLIVEPTIPIWVDRCSPHKETDQSRRSKRKKRSKGQGNGNMGLYRSLSNNCLSTKPPAHPVASHLRKGSGSEVNSAGLLFAPSSLHTGNSRSTDKECVRDGRPPLSKPLTNGSTRRRAASTNCSASVCSIPSLPLSCNQPFSLKGATLTSSLTYYGGYGRSTLTGVQDPFGSQPNAEEFAYENVGQKVYG